MSQIEVSRSDVGQSLSRFAVRVADGGDGGGDGENGASEHLVTLSGADYERLGRHYRSPEELIRACFVFLLERESKQEILRSFDVSQIAGYYPEFEQVIDQPPV